MLEPANIPDAFGPFFKLLDTVQGNLAAIIPKARDQQTREMFAGILAELKVRQAKLAVVGPQAVAESVAINNAALEKLAVLGQKKDALLAKIDDILAKSKVSLAEAEAKSAVLKAQPKKIPAMPRKSLKKKVSPLDLSTGDLLRKWIMASPPPPTAAHEGGFPRTSGNIWENWAPVTPPARETEDEDLEEFDREEEDIN
jgi:hypothetical protein